MSMAEGERLTRLRSAIAAAFPESTLSGSASLTPGYLAGVDVLVISSVAVIVPLSLDEQAALHQFVVAGGSALIFTDNADFAQVNASCLTAFGLTTSGYSPDQASAIVTNPHSHPVTEGRFGVIQGFEMFYGGWFTSLGPDAASLATLTFNGEPCLAVIDRRRLSPTSGLVVFFSDASMIFDDLITPDDQALVLNAIGAAMPTCSIATQPASRTARVGRPVDFTVAPGGSGPFAYQWRRDGVNLTDGGVVGQFESGR